jgi:hypothetical protein
MFRALLAHHSKPEDEQVALHMERLSINKLNTESDSRWFCYIVILRCTTNITLSLPENKFAFRTAVPP